SPVNRVVVEINLLSLSDIQTPDSLAVSDPSIQEADSEKNSSHNGRKPSLKNWVQDLWLSKDEKISTLRAQHPVRSAEETRHSE
ncbi:MAG: hypothetical protein OEZ23_07795, partial [Gammaproteobacteria bacterium]|nr:hypothetical protein [Gammaproteobacteria bacterium]